MALRARFLGGALLATASASFLAGAAQEGGGEKRYPVIDVTRVRYEPARAQEVTLKLHEIRAHLVQNRPDFQFSACNSYMLEMSKEVYLLVQAESMMQLGELWNRDDPQLERLLEELNQLGTEEQTVFLRQIAGVRREGRDVVTRPFVRWKVRARIGKLGTALATARELTDHVNAAENEVEARAFVEYFGRAGTIWWTLEVSGPHGWEVAERRLQNDPVFLEILDRGADAFVDDSFDDRWIGPI